MRVGLVGGGGFGEVELCEQGLIEWNRLGGDCL